jgi:hypothetical protein
VQKSVVERLEKNVYLNGTCNVERGPNNSTRYVFNLIGEAAASDHSAVGVIIPLDLFTLEMEGRIIKESQSMSSPRICLLLDNQNGKRTIDFRLFYRGKALLLEHFEFMLFLNSSHTSCPETLSRLIGGKEEQRHGSLRKQVLDYVTRYAMHRLTHIFFFVGIRVTPHCETIHINKLSS